MFKNPTTDRLFKAGRRLVRSLGAIGTVRKAAGIGRQNRLIRQALLELDAALAEGDTARLEYLLGLLHLSYVLLDDARSQDLHKRLGPVLRRIYQVGQNDLEAPTQSSAPLAYFLSYPRSGNTLATRLTAKATLGQIFSAMEGGVSPFSKRVYPKSYPMPRLIKDHVAHRHYRGDKCVLVVRDGRDTVTSLAFMTMQQGQHSFTKRTETADFIRWTAKSYVFGSWALHVEDLMALRDQPNKLLVRFEDLTSNVETFCRIVDFFDPGNKLPRNHLIQLFEERDAVAKRIQESPDVNDQWGFGKTFEPDSMYYYWSLNRKGSSWRESWDRAAKRAFHETGATEALIALGYEADPDWWRD